MKTSIVQNYAKRLHEKYELTLPVDLDGLASKYAILKYTPIPMDIDGVCADLKVTGKKTRIYVNSETPPKRQRFTLAHEIGHVIIPWHTGTVFDLTTLSESDCSVEYWEMEHEANSFATELLMPSSWVEVEVEANLEDIYKLHKTIVNEADVSNIAACLRLIQFLPPGYMFVAVDHGSYVQYSGKSNNTIAPVPSRGTRLNLKKQYTHSIKNYVIETSSAVYYWLHLPIEIGLPNSHECCDWRTRLKEIFKSLKFESSKQQKMTQQLNGVLGFANSVIKREVITKEKLYGACIQRLEQKEHLAPLYQHPDFPDFLVAKINDLVAKVST